MTVTKEELIQKIDGYLKGEISKKEASSWATEVLHKSKDGEHERDIEEAVLELFGLHDEDDRIDTAPEDLEKTLKKLREKLDKEQE